MNLVVVVGFLWVFANGNWESGLTYGYQPLTFNSMEECEKANKGWTDTNKTVPITLPDGTQKDVEFKATCTELVKP